MLLSLKNEYFVLWASVLFDGIAGAMADKRHEEQRQKSIYSGKRVFIRHSLVKLLPDQFPIMLLSTNQRSEYTGYGLFQLAVWVV